MSTLRDHLGNTVITGTYIPLHDETFDHAAQAADALTAFHAHIAAERSPEQADQALIELATAVTVWTLSAGHLADQALPAAPTAT